MDYDDNDFQSQNLHLAGEGSNKFPPVLRSFALPKFDFDDSLHGSLRFDTLVETEVFLGIESNEDSQWIEDYSKSGSGIQFGSSAAESCTISRRNNVWSEATSSESVEMLLKSVGQEELIPAQTNTKVSDACDELGCIIKHMEPSLKQDSNIPARVGDVTVIDSRLLPVEGNFPVLDDDGGGRKTLVEDSSQTCKGDVSVDQNLVELSTNDVGVRLTTSEGNSFIKDTDTIGNTSIGTVTEEGYKLGEQIDVAVTTEKNATPENAVLNNEDASTYVNKTVDKSTDVSSMDCGKYQEIGSGLSQEAQRHTQVLNAKMIDNVGSHINNPLCMASVESVVETGTIGTTLKQDSSFEVRHESEIDAHEVLLEVVEGNTAVERHEVETINVGNMDIVSKSGASLLSTGYDKASQGKVDVNSSSYRATCSSLTEACSSIGLISEVNAEANISPSTLAGSMQTCEKDVISRPGDDDKDAPVRRRENTDMSFDNINTGIIVNKGAEASSLGEDITGTGLAVPKSQSDCCTAVNESSDGISVPSGDGIKTASVDHNDVELSPLPSAHTYSDEKGDISAQISTESNLAERKAASSVTVAVHSVLAVDSCNTEIQIEAQGVAIGEVGQECMKDKEAGPVSRVSTVNKENSIDVGASEDNEKKHMSVSEPAVKFEMHGPQPSAVKELCPGSSQVGQDEPAISVSGGASFDQIAVPIIKVGQESCSDIIMPPSDTPTVARPTKLSNDQSDEERIQRSSSHSVSVSEATYGDAMKVKSASTNPHQNNVSNNESSFTFEINSLADLPKKGAKWQTLSNAEVSKPLLIVDESASNSGLGQAVPNVSQAISHGSPKISDIATPHSGSKGNSDRKPRRVSGKVTDKETPKRGKPTKEATPVRLERGNKVTTVSLSPSFLPQLVQSNDLQHFGHINSNSTNPLVATSTSGIPDLNSSVSQTAIFQQPFTDLQQVQLRAQIFVYGALIQGTAPDEAYMISAFGGLNSDRSIWENSWRSCMERLHGQRSHIITPETPAQSHSGARAAEQSIKQSAVQSKVASSSIACDSSKSAPIVNPVVPFSSPLWSMSTPGDTLQSSGMQRGPVMDYQRPLSPLRPHQTPIMRNFVGHSPSWLSQAPFGGPWLTAPPTSILNTSGRFSVRLPITEPVQFTPAKESSISCSSGTKPTASVAHSTSSTSGFPGPSVLDVKIVTASAGQPSADPKPRKRKKTSANENHGHVSLPLQPQLGLVTASAVASSVSASVAITAPHGFDSKAFTENFITSVTPISSTNLGKGDQNAELSAILPECLGNVQEARIQADVAAAHAASAVTHSQEIWDQLDKQRNVDLLPDIEIKLASAAVSLAAAAAVAKAAAAAARVASNAALQAKLMAKEALVCVGQNKICQSNIISFSGGMENLGKATPASILKGGDRTNNSSILVAAREADMRRVEDASVASKRAENMDAIIKAAELAAEAVSQAGRIVATGDPLPLTELVAAGPEGYWKTAQENSELVSRLNYVGRENINVNSLEGPDMWARQLKEVPSEKKENQVTSQGKSSSLEVISRGNHNKLIDANLVSSATTMKDKGQKDCEASDLEKTVEVAPESGNGSKSSIVWSEYENAEALKENSIKEDSNVEVFKDGNGFKAAWFLAKVLSLKDGKAYVNYTELTSGSEKLKEWVPLEGDRDEAPRIRIARPITVLPFKGTRKRRRASMGEHTWSVGDRVDAWMHDRWWEGIITENSNKDESVRVDFPAQGESTLVSKWNLRPSLIWKDGEWIEWSSLGENNRSVHGGDTPQEKRPRVRSPEVVAKGKDKDLKTADALEFDKSDDPTILALSTDEKVFNIGKSARDGNRTDAPRMLRTGLQKEGSKVVFGVPKPGKKRKFMEVSKHYISDRSGKLNEANDLVKFTKYLMPQGAGSRGSKSTKIDMNEKQPAMSKSKVLKSGTQNISGRTIPPKETFTNTSVSIPGDSVLTDHVAKTKDSVNHSDNASENNLIDFQSFSASEATKGPILFSALTLPSDNVSSRKIPQSNARLELASKGKLAPTGGKYSKIEDKTSNGNSTKSTSDHAEPRRSNRRIQPTSRLLEGLQSSLMVSKIPSVLHDKSHKSRNVSRGTNNHG